MGQPVTGDPVADIFAHFVTRSGLVLWAVVDRAGQVIEANSTFTGVFGSGRSISEIAVLADGASWADLLEAPSASVLSLSSRHSAGTVVVRVYPVGENVHLLGIQAEQDELLSRVSADFAVLAFSDRKERRSLKDRAEKSSRAALTDPLTKLANRRRIDQRIDELGSDGLVSAAMVDIDHFKSVNDVFGHATGDDVLAEVAGILASQSRGSDLAGRYGGEEFLVLFGETNLVEAAEVAERMRAAIEQSCHVPDGRPVTVSIGVAERQPGEALDATVARADQSLYLAKQGGRNRVVAADG